MRKAEAARKKAWKEKMEREGMKSGFSCRRVETRVDAENEMRRVKDVVGREIDVNVEMIKEILGMYKGASKILMMCYMNYRLLVEVVKERTGIEGDLGGRWLVSESMGDELDEFRNNIISFHGRFFEELGEGYFRVKGEDEVYDRYRLGRKTIKMRYMTNYKQIVEEYDRIMEQS